MQNTKINSSNKKKAKIDKNSTSTSLKDVINNKYIAHPNFNQKQGVANQSLHPYKMKSHTHLYTPIMKNYQFNQNNDRS